MKKRWDGKFLYYFGGIILSLFLCVGLVHMITGGESRDEKTELAESSQEEEVRGTARGKGERKPEREGNRWEGGQDCDPGAPSDERLCWRGTSQCFAFGGRRTHFGGDKGKAGDKGR